jgi:hypothetical protein
MREAGQNISKFEENIGQYLTIVANIWTAFTHFAADKPNGYRP